MRTVVLKYPQKLGGKRSMALRDVMEATSIAEIHQRAADAFLNELSYKSPKDFAEIAGTVLSFNLLECSSFHAYAEIKATRDAYIHNRGIANEVYVRKADSHVRAKVGAQLPVSIAYFLDSYEHCLSMLDWLEEKLHAIWHSSEHELRKLPQQPLLPLLNPVEQNSGDEIVWDEPQSELPQEKAPQASPHVKLAPERP
jgi:hypothetical protein